MIELSTNTAVMLYLSLTIVALLGTWLYQHFKSSHKKMISHEKELFVCEYCHFVYLNDNPEINRCPQCSSYNKNNKYHENL